jgi:hypothetical protein
VKQTLLQNDPGYQQAREWWRSQQAQAGQTAAQFESTAAENERLRSELEQERQQYSKLYDRASGVRSNRSSWCSCRRASMCFCRSVLRCAATRGGSTTIVFPGRFVRSPMLAYPSSQK